MRTDRMPIKCEVFKWNCAKYKSILSSWLNAYKHNSDCNLWTLLFFTHTHTTVMRLKICLRENQMWFLPTNRKWNFQWFSLNISKINGKYISIITEVNRSLVALISAAYFHFTSKHNKNICWFGKSDVRMLLEQCQNSVDALRFMCTYWWIYFIYLPGFATYLGKI